MKTEQEQLDFINRTCNTTYKSMDEVDWYDISKNYNLSEDFIREFQDYFDWFCISRFQTLSESFIREFQDRVDWIYISYKQKLSENFIREFQDKVDWWCISQYQNLSESFIKEFVNKVEWFWISSHQKLSEDFIREFQDKVYWECISYHQKLSEDFIREFKDKVDWDYIFDYQKLSEDFIKEFKELMIEDNDKQYTTHTETVSVEPLVSNYNNKREQVLNITFTEEELLEKLKNPQLPALITNIQYLELLLQKIDKQINENNFYHIEMKWTGDGITDGESNDDIFDLDTSLFTEEELKEYMQCLHSVYEIKLKKLKSQYLDIFYGDKYRKLITE